MEGLVGEQADLYLQARVSLRQLGEFDHWLDTGQFAGFSPDLQFSDEQLATMLALRQRASEFSSALNRANPPAECEWETFLLANLTDTDYGFVAWWEAIISWKNEIPEEFSTDIQQNIGILNIRREAAKRLFQTSIQDSLFDCPYLVDILQEALPKG